MVHEYLERIRCLFGSIGFIGAAKMGVPKIEDSLRITELRHWASASDGVFVEYLLYALCCRTEDDVAVKAFRS